MKTFIVTVLFSVSICANRSTDYQKISSGNVCSASVINSLNKTAKSWLFPIYMGGANSLESYIALDVNEMMQVGSNRRISVSTQEAKLAGTNRYYIEKDSHLLLNNFGIINSADKTNLENFCRTIFQNYPSDRISLILWDHGFGPEEPPFTDTRSVRKGSVRTLLLDENFPVYDVFDPKADVMSTLELVSALSTVTTEFNRTFDIIAFNACKMMSIEILSAVAPYCNYVVGSEIPMYACGFGYDLILSPFQTQTLLPADLCRLMTQTFEQENVRKGLDRYQLSAAYANDDVSNLETKCGEIGDYLSSCLNHQTEENPVIDKLDNSAWAAVLIKGIYEYELPDAKLFFSSLWGENEIETGDLDGEQDPKLLTNLKDALADANTLIDNLVFSKVGAGMDNDAQGLTIYFPLEGYPFFSSYKTLNFAENKWWSFIEKYASFY